MRLRQIVFNLLSNAMKFTEAGAVSLRALVAGETDPRLCIVVRDTGLGIPADKLDLIFESFRQVDAGTTRRFGGSGLGLAICRNLARAMDGDVTVASTPGEGATFVLTLPLLEPAMPQVGVAAEAPAALLILDQNPIARSMLRAVLEARAGTVLFASSAGEAMETLAAGNVAQILIDGATLAAAGDAATMLAALTEAARAAGAATALVSRAPDDANDALYQAAGIGVIIVRPFTAATLLAALFPAHENTVAGSRHLVTRAA